MDKKISELDQALQINNDAVFPISQDNGGTDTTYKVSITQISSEVGEDQTFSNLQTTSKKLVGAINELYQGGGGGGSSTLAGLSDVDIDDQTLSDGQVLKYDSAEDKWVNDDVGAGGHTIVADDGTDLTQRANLQFIGAYSEDNSVDDTTEVNVVRNMTKAQFDLLTADEKTGFINTTDETSQIYATEIPMSALDSDTVAEKLDDKVDKTDFDATLLPIQSGSATNTKDYIDSGLSGKADSGNFTPKVINQSSISVTASGINTLAITVNNAVYGIVTGIIISGDAVVPMQFYFSDINTLNVRLKNTLANNTTCNLAVYYI